MHDNRKRKKRKKENHKTRKRELEIMIIEINTKSYNPNFYKQPWCAKVDYSENPSGDFDFSAGSWMGRKGEAGTHVIRVNPMDVIVTGQKALPGADAIPMRYFIAQPDGTVLEIPDRVAAYRHHKEMEESGGYSEEPAKMDLDQLIARREELIAELAKVNDLIASTSGGVQGTIPDEPKTKPKPKPAPKKAAPVTEAAAETVDDDIPF
jgi:hypothetical protein